MTYEIAAVVDRGSISGTEALAPHVVGQAEAAVALAQPGIRAMAIRPQHWACSRAAL